MIQIMEDCRSCFAAEQFADIIIIEKLKNGNDCTDKGTVISAFCSKLYKNKIIGQIN